MTVHYDAATSSYSLSIAPSVAGGGRSFTFGPANIQPSLDPNVTIYQVVDNSGSTPAVETLYLSKNSASTYSYVGAGVWTRTQRGTLGNSFTRSDAFTYGVETPDAALPRTGSATFNVQLAGTLTSAGGFDFSNPAGIDYMAGISGSGTLTAGFASGSITLTGTAATFNPYTGITFGTAQNFGGTATLSSTTNNFNGSFTFGTSHTGNWLGRFYGPGAEEVGATFFGLNNGSSSDSSVTGAIIGKRAVPLSGVAPTYSDVGGWMPAAAPVPAMTAPAGPGPAATLAEPARSAILPGLPGAQPDGIPRLPPARDFAVPGRE